MNSYLFTFAIITTLSAAFLSVIEASFEEYDEYKQKIELMKRLEKEKMKSKLFEQFGTDKPPALTKSLTRLPNDVIQKLFGDMKEKPSEEAQNDLAEMYIFPINSNFECKIYDISFCQIFEYRISSDVDLSSSEFWVYKKKPWYYNNVTISVLCLQGGQEILKQEDDFTNENITMEWALFHLGALNDIKFKGDNITCKIEIKGIVMDLHNLPYLKAIKNKEVRVRREIDNDTIINNGCKAVPFNVSFEELGYADWIVQPTVYQANICVGYCLQVQNHHENFLITLLREHEKNDTKCDHCWFTCCRPKEYKSLSLIYLDKANVYIQSNMTNMIVSSCSCS